MSSTAKVYELAVELIGGPIEIEQDVSRRLRIHGTKTLHDLHDLVREAFAWNDEEAYDFLFGAPYEREARRFTGGLEDYWPGGDSADPDPRTVQLKTLELHPGQTFGYLFDFGEEWLHRVTVLSANSDTGPSTESAVTERCGTPPSQHPSDGDFGDDILWAEIDGDDDRAALQSPYDPDIGPDPQAWLAMGEQDQLLLICEAHGCPLPDGHAPIPSLALHATIHAIAETRIASGDPATAARVARRLRSGVSRHQVIHELGEDLTRTLVGGQTPERSGVDESKPNTPRKPPRNAKRKA